MEHQMRPRVGHHQLHRHRRCTADRPQSRTPRPGSVFHSRYVPSRSRGPDARPPSPKNRASAATSERCIQRAAPPSTGSHQRGGRSRRSTHTSRRAHLDRAVPGHRDRHPLRHHPPAAVLVRLQHRPRVRLGARAGQRVRRLRFRTVPTPEDGPVHGDAYAQLRAAEPDDPATGPGSASRTGPGTRARSAPRERQPRRVGTPPAPRRPYGAQPLGSSREPTAFTERTRSRPSMLLTLPLPATARGSFNCRSPVVGPHLHDTDCGAPALVQKSITWHRPCQPRHAHTPCTCAADAHDAHSPGAAPCPPRTPQPLWQPDPERIAAGPGHQIPDLGGRHHGAPADGGYPALHRWSVDELDTFWEAVTEWFDVRFSTPYDARARRPLHARRPRGSPARPSTTPSTRCGAAADPTAANRPCLRRREPRTEPGDLVRAAPPGRLARRRTARARRPPRRPGQRLPPEHPARPSSPCSPPPPSARVWTSCAPDFGARSVLDRFQQVEPVVLFAVDGYRYGGKAHDRRDVVAELRAELPTLRAVVHVPLLGAEPPEGALDWSALTAGDAEPVFEQVPFDHPLWVLYSSGTTGLPKAIVQSQGGILVEHLKQLGLHCDLGPEDRFFWYTSTGWMMWNFLVSGLLTGTTIVLYDGSPGHPDTGAQWRIAERTGHHPVRHLGRVRHGLPQGGACTRPATSTSPGSGASPPPAPPCRPTASAGCTTRSGADLWIASVSGGTDVCSCFAGAVPTLPVYIGELQAPGLGTDLQSWDPDGRPPDRRGRRTRRHQPHAVDAGPLLERPRRQPLPRQLLRHLPRRLAARRLDHRHLPRLRRHPRPLRLHAQPARRAHGLRRHLRGRSSGSPRSRSPWSSASSSPTAATGCRSSCTSPPERVLDDALLGRIKQAIRDSSPHATSPTRSSRSPASRTPSPESASRSRSSASSRAPRWRRPSTPAPSTTSASCTSTRTSPASDPEAPRPGHPLSAADGPGPRRTGRRRPGHRYPPV